MKKIILIILAVVLCAGVVGGSIVGIIKLTDSTKFDTKEISKFSYSVGGLDGSGKYMSTNASIYTKDAFECQGLECALDFDNSVSYQIYFYDQNNDFVHTTGKLTGAFVKDSVPFFAKYARIVITPNDDDVVSKLEVVKYAKQLTVKVNREQGYKNYTENLFVVEKSGKYSIAQSTGELVEESAADAPDMNVSTFINVSNYKNVLVFRLDSIGTADNLTLFLYDENKNFIEGLRVGTYASSFVSSENICYYTIDFNKLNKEFTYMRTFASVKYDVQILCR